MKGRGFNLLYASMRFVAFIKARRKCYLFISAPARLSFVDDEFDMIKNVTVASLSKRALYKAESKRRRVIQHTSIVFHRSSGR